MTPMRVLMVLRGAKVVLESLGDKTNGGQTAEIENSAVCHKECLILRRCLCAVWSCGWSAQSAHLCYCVEHLIFFMTPLKKNRSLF